MFHRFYLTLLLLISAITAANADIFDSLDDVVSPDAIQARAISKVMMPSPSLLTGACQFAIPLYIIKVEDFELPITLIYHSNGIKVYDDPRPIGYGWNLSPYLRITRTIMGRPDEYCRNVASQGKDFAARSVENAYGCNAYQLKGLEDKPAYDSEYDIYTIHLVDNSLTVIYKEGKFIGVNNDEYRIVTNDKLKSIQVTDPMGNCYDFSIKGACYSESSSPIEWLLSSIVLQSGSEIKFEWEKLNSFQRDKLAPPRSITYDNDNLSDSYQDYYGLFERTQNTVTELNSLLSIVFPGGKLTCNYTDEMLDNVKVKNSTSIVYSASLGHEGSLLSYVESCDRGKFSFTYNPAPSIKHESASDWWGYPNGKLNKTGMSHLLSPYIRIREFPKSVTSFGVDRSVNATESMSYLLHKVQHPTGGTTIWEYEPHRFNSPKPSTNMLISLDNEILLTQGGGVRVKSITYRSIFGDSKKEYFYGNERNGLARIESAPFLMTFVDLVRLAVYNPQNEMLLKKKTKRSVLKNETFRFLLFGVI
ncbi:MAG: hypothetical protein K2M07_06855 [Muribaculaceae bacterium]|nr:hypothetical protein [Muribaculaceae bacterium]